MITLEQAYYGRDPEKGYRLLGSSDPKHDRVVTRLCEEVGTPDGSFGEEPFYLHYLENGFRYMIAGCAGTPDRDGRMTLFFHAFIGDHLDLERAGFGIGALIHEKAFRTEYEPGPLSPAKFEETRYSLPWGEISWRWNSENLAIRSSKPELPLLSGLLKNRIDSTSWASFSFRPIRELQLYVISEYVPLPGDRKCVAVSGELIRQPPSPIREPAPAPEPSRRPAPPRKRQLPVPLLLLVSLFCGVVIGWFARGAGNAPAKEEVKPTTNICSDEQKKGNMSAKEKEVITSPVKPPPQPSPEVLRAKVIQELQRKFEEAGYERLKSSSDFADIVKTHSALKNLYEKNRTPQGKTLHSAENYIRFVHKFIFEEKEEGK